MQLNTWAQSWGSSWGSAWGTIKQDQARSGYYRLFLSQLQEESLKQDELRKKQQEEKDNPKPVEAKKLVKVKKSVKRVVKTVEEEFEDGLEDLVPPFRPLPAFTRLPDEPNYGAFTVNICQQVRVLLAEYSVVTLKFNQSQLEDEEDLELLLIS